MDPACCRNGARKPLGASAGLIFPVSAATFVAHLRHPESKPLITLH